MDVMGMYWVDFGVPQWSGPFRLLERTDTIDMSGWRTTIQLISEGTDPLGTQGRVEETIPKPPPKKITAKKADYNKQGVVATSYIMRSLLGKYFIMRGATKIGEYDTYDEANNVLMRMRS
jgi:hypothetical protein